MKKNIYDPFCVNHPKKRAVTWTGHHHEGRIKRVAGLCRACYKYIGCMDCWGVKRK